MLRFKELFSVVVILTSSLISYAGTTNYQYDAFHRLKQVNRSDGSYTLYTYDDVGNRTALVITQQTSGNPIAQFSANPLTGTPPLTVQFADQSTGTVSSWYWSFGDGGISTERNPSHIYQNAGTYTVSLDVIGNGMDYINKRNYITVQSSAIVDTDYDGIDDNWEIDHFGNLITATTTSDFDKDGYSDKQEYFNQKAGLLDPSGNVYDPNTVNAPGGPGYSPIAPMRVPETGQTKCYDGAGSVITCPSPGQALYGQDANYTINPISYTKLGANGVELPDSATEWIMVRDNVTGKIWEMKTNKDGVKNYNDPHDADNTYTWYDSNPATNGCNVGTSGDGTDTEDFIKALNDAHYGGYNDWRLPTVSELVHIVNYAISDPGPTIDSGYFPYTQNDFYWSSTTYTFDTGYVWGVDFLYGPSGMNLKSTDRHVRAVRGGQSQSDYVNNNDGTVTDKSTGLMWQQAGSSSKTWEQALAYCEGLNLGGYTDWRMPTIKELGTLVDYSRLTPSINTIYFPDTFLSFYWSSTTCPRSTVSRWAMEFGYGYSSYLGNNNSVRAVRGGQIGSPTALFSANPLTGSAPLTVQFTDQSTGTVSSWSWEFGDGGTSTAQNPSHTYQNAGTYTVSLTVTGNGTSDIITKSSYITVQSSAIVDSDNDGIDDNWEIARFGNLTTATATSDFDKDGYSDKQEYLNYAAGLMDPSGNAYDPKVINTPGGTGYSPPVSGRVPDTGQTKCYDVDGNVITCPMPSQPLYGQDAQYTINPMSYTKLDGSGNALLDSATSWVMVQDNVTGLIWEVKNSKDGTPDYSNPHDVDNTYTWYDSNPATNGGYAGTPGNGTDTEDFINALNSAHFGGYSDWRLPTIKELASIGNNDIPYPGPAINTTFFPNTQSSIYWSSTTHASSTGYVWRVNFCCGYDDYYLKADSYYVRAVRGGQSQSTYVENGNGTVTDTSTGLMWQQDTPDDAMTWEQALSYCEDSNLAGYTDWRLPTKKELRSLVDCSRYNPAINITYFPDTVSNYYWSSTTDAYTTNCSLGVYFLGGYDYDSYKGFSGYVRAVRLGQAVAPIALFSANPSTGTAPVTVQFTDQSTGTVSSWLWSFGDGGTSTAQNPSHTYQNAGVYTVSLTVNGNGIDNTTTKDNLITVTTSAIVDTDNDGIDDNWEITNFGNLNTANATSDYDKDGYSDKQEYLNQKAGLLDPSGNAYDPKTVNAPGGTGYLIIFSDDFNDNIIDTTKWVPGPQSVKEEGGIMKLDQVQTDNGCNLASVPISINTLNDISISRKVKLHYANEYYTGVLYINPIGAPQLNFAVIYGNYNYQDSRFCPFVGFFIARNNYGVAYCNGRENLSYGTSPIWDQWFSENIIYSPITGMLKYFINDELKIEFNVGALPNSISEIQLVFSPYGWWTGHYQYFDDLIVRQASIPGEKGDVNGDGHVDLTDAILCIQVLTGMSPNNINRAADVNGDGKIGMAEAIYVMQKVAGLK